MDELGCRRAAARFATALDAFSRTLSSDERGLLLRVLLASADPLDRMKHVDASTFLDDGEAALLERLSAMTNTRT